MINFKLKFNKKGFTLVETMVAIFILSISLVGIIGMVSRNYMYAMYAKNEITATYLIQEAVDYIRYDRDSRTILSPNQPGNMWSDFVLRYSVCSDSNNGCYVDVPTGGSVTSCALVPDNSFGTIKCPRFYFNENIIPFYDYSNGSGDIPSNFKRKILVEQNATNPNQLDITVSVEWKNGNLVRSRNLQYNLLNWNSR